MSNPYHADDPPPVEETTRQVPEASPSPVDDIVEELAASEPPESDPPTNDHTTLSAAPLPPPPPHHPQSSHAISQSMLRCVHCGYNLTGVTLGGACPECHTPVELSLRSNATPLSGKAIAGLVLGICAIPGLCMYGIPGIICGLLSLMFYLMTRSDVNAGVASADSLKMALAGAICGTVALVLSLSCVGFFVALVVMEGV